MVTEKLIVWFENERVGELFRNKPTNEERQPLLGFIYDSVWIDDGFRLSQNFYLTKEEYPAGSEEVYSFFSNLLPEEAALEKAAHGAHLSRSDTFALLKEYGGDCAGAISILQEGITPDDEYGYRELTKKELAKFIEKRGIIPFKQKGPKIRLSLAGAQSKTPVFLDEQGAIMLPVGVAPSTHILKFSSEDYPGLLINEYFMLKLAKEVGLNVIEAELRWHKSGKPYLLIERYDRLWIDGTLKRLHQQDFAQAQDGMPRDKYENINDPELSLITSKSCYTLIRDASITPLPDVTQFLAWHLFNFLAGNADGHAKNVSLLQQTYRKDEWGLAKFYDLVCTRIYENLKTENAFAIGGCHDTLELTRNDLERYAKDSGIHPRMVREQLLKTAEAIEMKIDQVASEVSSMVPPEDETIAEIVETIKMLCATVKQNIAA